MNRTIFLISASLLLVIFCFGIEKGSAASSGPKRGGMITVGTGTDVVAVDPHVTSASITAGVMNHVFERLVGYGENLELVPILAERWEVSPDLKTYLFFLRKGKLFHNGREMVADDVKYSIERILDPKTNNPRRSTLENISRIEVVDKYTVRLHMNKPDGTLLSSLAFTTPIMAVVPREEVEKQGGTMKHPVGTGPYKFVEWKPDRHVLLERFEQYKPQPGPMNGFGGEQIAYLDRIKFVPVPEESVATMALLNKEIDFLLHVPFKNVEKFRTDYGKRGIALEEIEGLDWFGIFFGCNKPVTKEVKFRRACAYAIDRSTVAEAATRGYAAINSSFVAVKNYYYTSFHKKWYPKDVEKAKQLLKEAGYPNGFEAVIKLPERYAYAKRSGEIIADMLSQVGIQLKIELIEWGQWIDRVFKNADYDLTVIGHAEPFDISIYANPKYYFRYDSPRFQETLKKAEMEVDPKVRRELFIACQKIVTEDAVNGFLFVLPSLPTMKKEVMNWWKDYPMPAVDVTEVWRQK